MTYYNIINKDVEKDQTQHQSLGSTISYKPPTRLCATDHNPPSSTSQPVLNSPQSLVIYPILPKLYYQDDVGDSKLVCQA